MSFKKAIIFGSNGQDGYFLKKLLDSKNILSILVSRKNSDIVGNVSDFNFVKKIIRKNKPNYIFHFAANSSINHDLIFSNNDSIVKGTLNILEASRLYSKNCRIFISGSAIQFVNKGFPISEKDEFDISNSYSLMRVQSVLTSRYYRDFFGLNIYIGYLFNHDSEMRSEYYINQKIAQTVLRIKNGSNEMLQVDDHGYRKEFNYAADIVEAIWTLVNQDKINESIIGCGKVYSILDWIKICFKIANLNYEDHTIFKKKKTESKILISNPKTIHSIGWKPKKTFQDLAKIMMSHQLD